MDRQEGQNGEPQRVGVVTLAVLPEDGERIALASTQEIVAGLRNPADALETKTAGIKLSALMRGPGAQPVIEQQQFRTVAIRRAPATATASTGVPRGSDSCRKTNRRGCPLT